MGEEPVQWVGRLLIYLSENYFCRMVAELLKINPRIGFGWMRGISCAVIFSILATASSAFAAAITWSAPVTISSDADVSTNGGLLYAYNDANVSTTVNGVPFDPANSMTAFGPNVALTGNFSWTTTAFGSSTGSPWTTLSAAYQNTLRGAAYTSNNGTQTVTLKNLIVGRP